MIHRRPSGFTLIELVGAMVIISVALISILTMLRVAVNFTNKSRQETIAINLAREGMEAVYHRRNTNWLKRSGERDKYRLCIDDTTTCSRFQGGKIYKPLLGNSTSFIGGDNFNIAGDNIIGNQNQNLYILTGSDFLSGIVSDGAYFYRAVIGVGLYQKDSNVAGGNLITCADGNDQYNGIDLNAVALPNEPCDGIRPKEFRFCSRVEYEDSKNNGKVELCGGISNYEE